ncbi:MAG: glycosyl hydrolase family 18 protein [Eubacteriales bacterium]
MEENRPRERKPKSNINEQDRYKKKKPIDAPGRENPIERARIRTQDVPPTRRPIEGMREPSSTRVPRPRPTEGAPKRPSAERPKRPPVEGAKRPPAEGTRRPPVEGTRRPPVEGAKRPPVEGTRRPSVDESSTIRGRNTMKKRSIRNKRRKKGCIIGALFLGIILLIGVAAGFLYVQRYSLSDEEMSSTKYYDISRSADLVAIMDTEILGVQGMWDSDVAYLSYDFVISSLNSRFYWDEENNNLLYTLEDGTVTASLGDSFYTKDKETTTTDYQIVKTEGQVVYVAAAYVQLFTNMDFETYIDPYRIVITYEWGDIETYTAKKDTEVRYQAGVKSPIVSYVSEDDILIYQDEVIDDWTKVCTQDGYIGYVQTKNLENYQVVTLSREFEEQTYSSISVDYTINMAWHQVTSSSANDTILSTIANTSGLTTIAPTWFLINSTEGDVVSYASDTYVNYAHQLGIEVWAVLNDFDGEIGSYDETYEVLSSTTARTNIINTIIAEVIRTGIDGINVDIELVNTETGVHFIQFIRELSVQCRKNGIILSVDNYPPKSYNMHYDYEEQGVVADYVVIMGYDEHYGGSPEAGSVSSITYVEEAITEMLTMVSADKIISGIPFYTRLWSETDKTAEELAEQEGTEDAEYLTNVSSETYGMAAAQSVVSSAGATATWDETTQQYYATWVVEEVTYQIWLEDVESIEAKLQLMQEYELAGTAAWKLGLEDSAVWAVIEKYVN